MTTINLADHFRQGTGAWHVAEKLLSGKPASRQELVGTEVSITTVNRVVEVLEEAGAKFERTVDGRQAIFQLIEVGSPKKRHAYPELDTEGKIVKDELVGEDHVIEFTTKDGRRYRGNPDEKVARIAGLPPVGSSLVVAGIVRGDNEQATVLLETAKGKKVTLEHVQNITRS